ALQANELLGPYQIAGLVGEGGMGAVYRAKDTRLGRDVAIKVLTGFSLSDRERLLRFEQEARATGMLNHPNLLTIYDVGRDAEGAPFLVSELLEGETLSNRLGRGPLSPRKAVDAALQMANGLAAAHEKGSVHRDLKPDNIFLTRDGRLKILDFGIAKLNALASGDGPAFEVAATEPGMVLGTVGYMSPEQVRGESVDQRSDIFSLGAIFYEMLTGLRAFRGNSGIETLGMILKEDPPELTDILPNLPPALERLVRRCLEKDRDLRFQNARDLGFNLETLSTMSQTSNTLSGVARTSATAPTAALPVPIAPTRPLPAAPHAPTARTAAAPAPTAARRPLTKPKPRVSPVLLALLFVAAVAGAAYGGWKFAQRGTDVVVEPKYHRMTFRRGEVRSARFTPDGQTIAYTAAWDGQPSDVYIATGRAAEARQLGIPDSEVLAISKNAELAILLRRNRITRSGTLARVPIGGGMPRELAEGVQQADWSPDGANLAVVRLVNGRTRVEYPLGTVKYESTREVRQVRVSPDGSRLAILEPTRGAYDVAIITNGPPEPIARGWSHGATGLAWSSDGKELYVSGTDTTAPPSLYAVNIETGAIRLVNRLTGSVALFDVSQKNEFLLATGSWRAALVWKVPDVTGSRGPEVAASTPTTGQPDNPTTTPATPQPRDPVTPERDASWFDWSILSDLSPDGKTILFSETREGGGAKAAVYLRRAEQPAPVRLADGVGDALSPDGKWALIHQGAKLVLVPTGIGDARELKIDGTFEVGAAWLPDSRRLVAGGALAGKTYQLHVIDTLDETATPISPEGIWSGGSRAFAVSPDGRLAAGMNSDETIVVYPTTGGDPVPVNGVEKGEIPIQWSADAASLLVYRPTALPTRVYRVHLATGTRELWRELAPNDLAGVYRISPVLVTPTGDGWAYNAMRTLSDLYVAEGLK
ncbi:MAG TPA: protein kinase, partial [Thermoanaerobaculia bacterium]|nr:protein kinase [Thermoanaerobaculia bacterium]